jgi:hypothetical protein
MSLETEAPPYHEFSEFWVANARDEGFLEMKDGSLIAHLREGDLVYRVLETPGVHEDEDEPAGYRITHHYACELVEQPPTHAA